jgi:hypothetical protein
MRNLKKKTKENYKMKVDRKVIGLCRNSEKCTERIKWSFFKNPAQLSEFRILLQILLFWINLKMFYYLLREPLINDINYMCRSEEAQVMMYGSEYCTM